MMLKRKNAKKDLELSPPWQSYCSKIKELFGADPDITIKFDNDTYNLCLYVDNTDKAEALAKILPEKKEFGGVTVTIKVIPANKEYPTVASAFKEAFKGNPLVKDVIDIEGAFNNPMTYFMFEKKVVQYYDDNLGDPYGNTCTLLQNVADEVFENKEGVFFSTSIFDDNTEIVTTYACGGCCE